MIREQGNMGLIVLTVITGAAVFYWDIRYFRIPDWLTWGSWGAGAVLVSRGGLVPLGDFLGGSAGAFLFFLLVYYLFPGGLGGGDVKLSGFTGGLGGVGGWFWTCYGALYLALLFIILFPAFRGKRRIPFGPFLWAGGVLARLLLRGGQP